MVLALCLWAGGFENAALRAGERTGSIDAEVEARLGAWVAEAGQGENVPGLMWELPAGAVLDRVEIDGSAAVAYLQIPGGFLGRLTKDEYLSISYAGWLRCRDLDELTQLILHARPAEEAAAAYRLLSEYVPLPPPVVEKPEPAPDRSKQDTQLKGGLPTYNPGRPNGALTGKTVFLSPGHGWYYSSTLERWATQRGNNFGLLEDHSNGEAVLHHLARYLHNAGANVWPCRERDFNTNMVIVDNTDGAPGFTTVATWPASTAAGNWWGSNYQYHSVSTFETATAIYTPDLPAAGYYAVYIWTPSASNRSTDAHVRVNHTGGTTTHVINMQQDGNTWRFLGQYYFNAGRDAAAGSVQISNEGSDPSKFVIADAVRFGGGFGSVDEEGGGTSGKPRWEEAGNYFAYFMGYGSSLDTNHVRAMPRYAKWESESWEDSIYFSWHTNAYNGNARGTDIYVYGPDGPGVPGSWDHFSGVAGSDTLATRIVDEVINDIRAGWDASWSDPGKLAAWFGELDPSENDEMPACLIEVAFHDNAVDAESIVDPRFRDLVSRAAYQAIVKWWYYHADGPNSSPIATATLLPEPPTHLSVRNLGDGTVRVSWQPPPYDSGDGLLGDPATGYLVCMSTDGYGFDDGTATSDTWMDVTDLEPGAIRYFRVIATNEGGQSFPSEIGGVRVSADSAPILIVNGFDRLDRWQLLIEDDPYDTDDLRRERPFRMNHYGYIRTFAAALQPTGVAFDFCANEAVRDGLVSLNGYTAVIWQCGEESSTLRTFDTTEQARVQAYLNGSGSLFVSGAEIGWDLVERLHGQPFYNDYLKADYLSDDAATYGVTPVAGSVFDGIASFAFDDGSTIYDVNYPDVMGPTGGSTAVLGYVGGTGGTAGILYDGAYRLVNFGFPFETITSESVRADLMQAVVDFLLVGPFAPGDFDHDGDVDMMDYGHLQGCLSGPYSPPQEPQCQNARLDGDSDVDFEDVLVFRGCLSGAGIAADVHCAD